MHIANVLLLSLWRASWQGALALLLIWTVCRALARRLPADAHCWLWRLGYVKLLVGLAWGGAILFPVLSPTPSYVPTSQSPAAITSAQPSAAVQPSVTIADASSLTASSTVAPKLGWQACLAFAYLLGIAVCLVRLLLAARRTRTVLRLAEPLAAGPESASVAELAPRLGLRRVPQVACSAELNSPVFLAGRVLLPTNARYADSDLRMILAHELAHARRRDLAWEWLGTLTQIVFFFHPLVVLARREERLAREAAADSLALRATDANAADYGKLLLSLALVPSRRPALVGAVGVIEGGSPLHRRLLALRDGAKRRLSWRAVAAISIMALALAPWQLTHGQAAPNAAALSVAAAPTGEINPGSPPTMPATMPAGDKSINGIVRDEKGGPAAGLRVVLIWKWSRGDGTSQMQRGLNAVGKADTDPQGRFTFSHLPAGQFDCIVDPLAKQYVPSNENVVIGNSDSVKTLTIVVSKGGLVAGRVVDGQTHQPLADVTVEAGTVPAGGKGANQRSPNGTSLGRTDDQGRYELRVKPGDVFVEVGHTKDSTAFSLRVQNAAQRVTVQNGKTTIAPDIAAELYPAILILGPDGKPVANAAIRFIPDDLAHGGGILDDHTDSTGAVALDRFQNGTFSIAQGGRNASGAFHWLPGKPLVITVNGKASSYPSGVGTVSLSSGSAATVALSVVSEDGKPIPNALVRIEEMDPKSHSIVDNQLFKADASGAYHASLDPNGKYYNYLRADGFNQVEIDPKSLVLKKGATTNLGAISLISADGEVSGRVVNDVGQPMSGVVASMRGTKTGNSVALTDSQGRFRIPNVVQGEHLDLTLCLKGEVTDSGQALFQSNEMMEISGVQASPKEREIVWRPKK